MNTNKLRCPLCADTEAQQPLTEEQGSQLAELLLVRRVPALYWRLTAFFCPRCQLPHLEGWPFDTERAEVVALLREKPSAATSPTAGGEE